MSRIAAVMVLIIVVAAIGFYLTFLYFPEPVTEPRLKEMVKERFPDAADGDISTSYENDCRVCDDTGCRNTGSPCWKANYTDGQTTHAFVVDSNTGSIVQESQNPCTEWWCTAQPCTYFYREIIPNGTVSHYNTGCDSPAPVCDQDYEKCRECSNPGECIRKTVTKELNETAYLYEVVGADAWGSINDTQLYCRIFDEGGEVFYNSTTIELCEEIMSSWSKCYGTCDFRPDFGMIPY
jgi:hypothetical protein